jgi:diguanylate cyclase (GGDEF)-like protein
VRIAKSWRLLCFTVGMIALALYAVISMTGELIDKVTRSAIDAEHNRNHQLVDSAVLSARLQLEKVAFDNAYWDDAVRNSYAAEDFTWFEETWMPASKGVAPVFNRSIVVDGMTGKVIYNARRGKTHSVEMDPDLKKTYDSLVRKLSDNPFAPAAASALTDTAYGNAIIALSPILPSSDSAVVDQAKPNYLVLVKDLDSAVVDEITRNYKIASLRYAAPGMGSYDLTAPDGQVLASLMWHDNQSMAELGSEVRSRSTWTLSLMAFVMVGSALMCWYYIAKTMRNEEKAKQDALHDALTGLPNRSALLSVMQEVLETSDKPIAIAFADLDGFKDVNDSFGHDLGDKLIKVVANGLTILCKDARLVCRMGGDEFVVLFSGDDATQQCAAFSENLIAFTAQPFEFDGRLAAVGASIGIATSLGKGVDGHELLRCADIAMYEAKKRGKNQWCVYQPSFDADRIDNNEISAELATVIENKQLEIVFQPIVDSRTGNVRSVEALARWPKDSAKSYPPNRFVRAAELSGQIDQLGSLILEKACAAAKAWGNLPVAINISPLQLNNPGFCQQSIDIIREAGIDPARIEFEITESVLVHDIDRARKVLTKLRDLGAKIALDDFGSGYSSIGYLRQFTFDRIKIDRSISSKVGDSPEEQAVVQGIMLIARGLAAEVTAEGVEHEHQAQLLRLTGCTALQGFWFHKPMAGDDVTRLLQEKRGNPAREAAAA